MTRSTLAEQLAAAMWPAIYPHTAKGLTWASAVAQAETSRPIANLVERVRAAGEVAAMVGEGMFS